MPWIICEVHACVQSQATVSYLKITLCHINWDEWLDVVCPISKIIKPYIKNHWIQSKENWSLTLSSNYSKHTHSCAQAEKANWTPQSSLEQLYKFHLSKVRQTSKDLQNSFLVEDISKRCSCDDHNNVKEPEDALCYYFSQIEEKRTPLDWEILFR